MEKIKVKVLRKIQNTPDVVTLYFVPQNKTIVYTAGQYVTVYFEDTDEKNGKAYSLSSIPSGIEISITVKKIGLFSSKLHELEPGDGLLISKPYGFFNVKNKLPIVAIASGVGISPIWSIIRDELGNSRSMTLLYSNKTTNDIVFKDEIDLLSSQKKIASKYFITRQPGSSFINRRIDITDVQEFIDGKTSFYICGSQDFVGAMWRLLSSQGVNERAISTETFFENQ